jgi:hypothetical protein
VPKDHGNLDNGDIPIGIIKHKAVDVGRNEKILFFKV